MIVIGIVTLAFFAAFIAGSIYVMFNKEDERIQEIIESWDET